MNPHVSELILGLINLCPMNKKSSIAACLFNLSPDADGAVQLFPAGQFDAPRGALKGSGPWRLDKQSANALIALASQRKNDILIDYEHQSLLSAENGKPAPAAGWFSGASLEYREAPAAVTGLFAKNIKWTAAASDRIKNDEYRYISPVFIYDQADGTVVDLINVALTNTPAIDGMQAVTAAASLFITQQLTLESDMEEIKEKLLSLLNLPTLASASEIGAELDKLKTVIGTGDQAACSIADVLKQKNEQIAALSVKASTPDLSKFVPIDVVKELQNNYAALSATVQKDQVSKIIADNLAKLPTPGLQAWASQQTPADLNKFLENAPELAALTAMQTNKTSHGQGSKTVLTDEQLAVCTKMGITQDAFIKSLEDTQ